MKILIAGVPGTGKTTLGKYFVSNKGFSHLDMEQDEFAPVRELKKDEAVFLEKLAPHENIVVTWGFGFFSRQTVESLREKGFTLFWLDGDRIASFKTFIHREKHNDRAEYAYYSQLMGIIASDIVARLKPIIINPFNEAGELRSTEQVALEIMSHTENLDKHRKEGP